MQAFIILLIVSAVTAKKDFTGYSVFKLWPSGEDQVKMVQSLDMDYDVWAEYNDLRGWAEVMVSPDQQMEFINRMDRGGVKNERAIPDVQKLINENDKITQYQRQTRNLGWTSYHTLEDINAWLEDMQEGYPDIVEIVNGGQSFEDRTIIGVKLSFGKTNRSAIIEGGIHSREWISPAAATYIINEFLTSTDPNIRDVAEAFDWHIFPVINPDGYIYTLINRMWRKNRSTQYICNDETAGVDLNRNFDYLWGLVGSSANPCTDTHAGWGPFSEPESRTFGRYVAAVPNLDIYLTLHSFSQLILVPFGHTTEHLDNYHDIYEIGIRAADAMRSRYNTEYLVGTSSVLLSPVSGNSRDWVKGVLRVPIVWLYELRDTGEYGFLLPTQQIIPNCLEVMDSLVSILDTGRNLRYFEYTDDTSDSKNLKRLSVFLIFGLLTNILFILYRM